MCGIAGMLSSAEKQTAAATGSRMLQALAHRGPDGEAQWQNNAGTVWLGHRRLKIIDLSEAAAQPMHGYEGYTIVHNGEIYNYRELRAELEKNGRTFKTASDTEVILAAYAEYGENCVKYFEGMFAFAIWDEPKQQLFAARDRFGEKPFYYHVHAGNFYFASEMKALWAAGIAKTYDAEMLLLYLGLGFTQPALQPERTFFRNIQALPPAHALTVKPGEPPRVFRYWQLDKNKRQTLNAEAAAEELRTLLYASVNKRLRSDVFSGTSLSGGIDSASIAAACYSVSENTYQHTCFTAGFPGFEKDETAAATETVKQFGLKQILVNPAAEALDPATLIYHHEQPLISSSAWAQYCVYRSAKENGITVLLDGQGADEILGGYTRYLHWALQEWVFRKPKHFNRAITALRKNGWPLEWSWKNYLAAAWPGVAAHRLEERARKQLFGNQWLNREFVQENFKREALFKPVVANLNDILYFTTTQQGLPDLLHMADRNSMAHGVEVRLPFLDHKLVEFVFSLPAEYKINEGYTKWLLRKAMHTVLPESINWRTGKTGFETPQQQWLQQPRMQEMAKAAVQHLSQQGMLRKQMPLPAANNEWLWRCICAAQITR